MAILTWEEMAIDNLKAAQLLQEKNHVRSSVCRSYYAVYCACVGKISGRKLIFAHGWNNPPHDDLPNILRNSNLTRGNDLGRLIRILRKARTEAEYKPGLSFDEKIGLNCLRMAHVALRLLGLERAAE